MGIEQLLMPEVVSLTAGLIAGVVNGIRSNSLQTIIDSSNEISGMQGWTDARLHALNEYRKGQLGALKVKGALTPLAITTGDWLARGNGALDYLSNMGLAIFSYSMGAGITSYFGRRKAANIRRKIDMLFNEVFELALEDSEDIERVRELAEKTKNQIMKGKSKEYASIIYSYFVEKSSLMDKYIGAYKGMRDFYGEFNGGGVSIALLDEPEVPRSCIILFEDDNCVTAKSDPSDIERTEAFEIQDVCDWDGKDFSGVADLAVKLTPLYNIVVVAGNEEGMSREDKLDYAERFVSNEHLRWKKDNSVTPIK